MGGNGPAATLAVSSLQGSAGSHWLVAAWELARNRADDDDSVRSPGPNSVLSFYLDCDNLGRSVQLMGDGTQHGLQGQATDLLAVTCPPTGDFGVLILRNCPFLSFRLS